MERLRKTHQQLASHFAAFSQQNTGCHYLIDHGLGTNQRKDLFSLVSEGIESSTLDSFEWQTTCLPLLVCAVEVGYDYQGNGTDFWPSLSKTLSYDFTVEDRSRLSRWFAKTSEKYSGVEPGTSDWEQAFCHIAWPITHAVAAKDIRRPFADCLRRFRRDVRNETLKDETIAADLAALPTTVGSRRFRTWLKSTSVVAGIVRDLLGGRPLDEAGLFTKSFRDRLIHDLQNEPEVQKAVRQVETARKAKSRSRPGSGDSANESEVRFGEFFLSQDDHGGYELCGEMPSLPKSVQQSLKPIRRRWKVRPWGYAGATPIPPDCLRSAGGYFLVDFGYVNRAAEDTPFFTGVDALTIDDQSKRWLESVRFRAAEMLAFPALEAGDDASHAIAERTPHRGRIWVLAQKGLVQSRRSEEDESYCVMIGEVAGGEIHEFDADNAQVREWLKWPQASVAAAKELRAFTWLHPSPVSVDSQGVPVYTTDDEIGLSVAGDQPVEVVLRKGANELASQLVSTVAMLKIETKGTYEFAVRRSGQEIATYSFVIVDEKGDGFVEPDPEIPWRAVASHVDAGETELSRKDLFNRRINLDIIGDRGIENLEAKLKLFPGDAVATVHLPRIPTRISANDTVWEELTNQLPTSVLKSPCDLLLSVEIEGLSNDTWRLESNLQRLWWEECEDGLPAAVCDDGVFQVQRFCVVSGNEIDLPEDGNPFLSIASDDEGNELHFDGRIDVIGDSDLHRKIAPPTRFLRQMDDIDGIAGLRTIAQRYLQLSAAHSSSLAAEVSRVGASQVLRDWMLHAVCGPNYVHKKNEFLELETINPIEVWWKCCIKEKHLLQPEPETERSIPENLPRIVLAEFEEMLPDSWWDGSISELDADDASPLDFVFRHLLDDEEVFVDADALTKSLRQANEQICGGHLADLIIPAEAGDELLGWHLAEVSISECASRLYDWVRRSLDRGRGRQGWTIDELQTWLNLLLYPERLWKKPWESVLEKLLHDRPVARAGAFIAWRLEQNARLVSFQSSKEVR